MMTKHILRRSLMGRGSDKVLKSFQTNQKFAFRIVCKLQNRESCNKKIVAVDITLLLSSRGSNMLYEQDQSHKRDNNCRTILHRTEVHEQLPSQAGIQVVNS